MFGFGGYEDYDSWEEIEYYLGTLNHWLNRDPDGQWFILNHDFICPQCAKELVEQNKVKYAVKKWEIIKSYINEAERPYAKPYIYSDGESSHSFEVSIPYTALKRVRKSKSKEVCN